MATITLRNVPDDLHRRLKEAAKRNRRSLNQEAIERLTVAPRHERPAAAQQEHYRRIRERTADTWLTQEQIDRYLDEGRE